MITITDIILFLTFLGLLWYALETRGMRKEMITQTKTTKKSTKYLEYQSRSTAYFLFPSVWQWMHFLYLYVMEQSTGPDWLV